MLFGNQCQLVKEHVRLPALQHLGENWTRLKIDRSILCNSLERVVWHDNPVQVVICEQCGFEDCAQGGYVNISRLEDMILWTSPLVSDLAEWGAVQVTPCLPIELWGSLAIPTSTWQKWTANVSHLPDPYTFPVTTMLDLGTAWRMEAKMDNRARSLEEISAVLTKRVVACDTLSIEQGLSLAQATADWFLNRAREIATGALRLISEVNGQVETFHFDGSAQKDWSALAKVGSSFLPVFGNEWVYVPQEPRVAG